MDLSDFAFRIILIFVPGIIAFTIVDKLTFHRETKSIDILLGSLTLGFLCYLFYYLLNLIIQKVPNLSKYASQFSFINSLVDKNAVLSPQEITVTTILSIPIGLVVAAISNHRILYKLAKKLRISNKLDNVGVWNTIFDKVEGSWIVIKDYNNHCKYEGWVEQFSDGLDENELFLRDVIVYENLPKSSKELYRIPGLYLSLSKENLIIEYWSVDFTDNINDGDNRNEPHQESVSLINGSQTEQSATQTDSDLSA